MGIERKEKRLEMGYKVPVGEIQFDNIPVHILDMIKDMNAYAEHMNPDQKGPQTIVIIDPDLENLYTDNFFAHGIFQGVSIQLIIRLSSNGFKGTTVC